MLKNFKNKSDYGFNNKAKGLSQNLENEIILFDSFMDAKGGKKSSSSDTPNETTNNIQPVTYVSGDELILDSEEYNIQLNFNYGEWTDSLLSAFTNAADFLSDLITDNIALDGDIDLTIEASLTNIDGEGGILGQAGPTHVWDTNNILDENDLTSAAIMEFDVADASYYESIGLWDDIVLHEMIHTLGFGTLWESHNLIDVTQTIDDNGTKKPTDDIIETTVVYNGEFATYYNGGEALVIETDGGSGTALGHWDEDTYVNELMTGYIDDSNYLSLATYGALEDLGYTINYDAVYTDTIA